MTLPRAARMLALLVALLGAMLTPRAAQAQDAYGPPAAPASSLTIPGPGLSPLGEAPGLNPVSVLEAAGRLVSGMGAGEASDLGAGPMTVPAPRGAGGNESQGLSGPVSVLLLLTVITLAPSIVLMCTCFVRIIIVLGILKQALGAQTIPPPQIIAALALFMTLVVMSPTVERINAEAIQPYREGRISDPEKLWEKARQPLRDFMFAQIDATGNWSSLYMILEHRGIDTSQPETLTRADVDMVSLIPAFMLSELKTAFMLGFRVYLPFLVIDMVVSAMLISMSMMMVPPVLISLPFKLLLFVLVDGWALVVSGLMSGFAPPTPEALVAGEQVAHAGALLARGLSGWA